jgi:uncharacterized damage-inducible protein DinB
MSEVTRIVDQMRRAWDGEAWHGPAVWTLLSDVSAREAEARPIAGAHTIAEIVFHMAFCKEEARRRVGGELVITADAESWPTQSIVGEAAWQETRALLQKRQQELEQTVAALTDDRLDAPVAGKNYNVYVLLHGLIQHDLYHAGQLALLKRAART